MASKRSAWSKVMSKSSTIFPISATSSESNQISSPYHLAKTDSVLSETDCFHQTEVRSWYRILGTVIVDRLLAASFADLSTLNLPSTHFLADHHAPWAFSALVGGCYRCYRFGCHNWTLTPRSSDTSVIH